MHAHATVDNKLQELTDLAYIRFFQILHKSGFFFVMLTRTLMLFCIICFLSNLRTLFLLSVEVLHATSTIQLNLYATT